MADHKSDDPYRTKGFSADDMKKSHRRNAESTIGPYKLLHEVGQGGMGTVWLAEQDKPVRRRVALKVIKSGAGSKEVLARFEIERQALAMMDHHNIARILDAGATADGQPFFAMEYVEGLPLTTYCDKKCLSIDERLALFTDVCSGVQHAHQKGIIHRDLKPSNILVCEVDGKPVPKVIDFGLAKALDSTQRLTDQSMFTGIGQILGTLKYMSPEQASLDSVDIDTRTDIYALGVILYELLTGTTPLDDTSIKGLAAVKVMEFIRDREPVKPSSRLGSSTDEQVSTITDQRRTDSTRLNQILCGDLDWIVMKALEKDRSRRYESASGFAADVKRFLNCEPVVARPPSLNYRLTRFVRKHRLVVVTVSAIFLAMLGAIVGISWSLVVANRAWNSEAKRAESERLAKVDAEHQKQVAEQATKSEQSARLEVQKRLEQVRKGNETLAGVFDELDIRRIHADREPLESVLAKRLVTAAEAIKGQSLGDILEEADLQYRLGTALLGLGFPAESVPVLEQCVAIRKQELGTNNVETISAISNLGVAYIGEGRNDEALETLQTVLENRVPDQQQHNPDLTTALHNTALGLRLIGKVDQAIQVLENLYVTESARLGRENEDTLYIAAALANCYRDKGRNDEALALHRETLKLRQSTLGETHIDTLTSMNDLALSLEVAKGMSEAIKVHEQTYKLMRERLGDEHPSTLTGLNNLGMCFRDLGQLDKAHEYLTRALELRRGRLGENHAHTLESMGSLATVLERMDRLDEAIELYEEASERMLTGLPADHPSILTTLNNLGLAYRARGRFDDAIRVLKSVLEGRRRIFDADDPRITSSISNLAVSYWSAGNLEESIPLLEDVLRRQEALLQRNHPATLRTIANLGVNYKDAGRFDDGIAMLDELSEATENDPSWSWALEPLVDACSRSGDLDRAKIELEKFQSWATATYSDPGADLAKKLTFAGKIFLKLGDPKNAESLLTRSLEMQSKFESEDWTLSATTALLGVAFLDQSRNDEASRLLNEGYASMNEAQAPIARHVRLQSLSEIVDALIRLAKHSGNESDLDRWTKERERLSRETAHLSQADK